MQIISSLDLFCFIIFYFIALFLSPVQFMLELILLWEWLNIAFHRTENTKYLVALLISIKAVGHNKIAKHLWWKSQIYIEEFAMIIMQTTFVPIWVVSKQLNV